MEPSSFLFNEGSLVIRPGVFTDRTTNIFFLGTPENSELNITVSRDHLQPGEDASSYVTRQLTLLKSRIKSYKLLKRYPVTLGSAESATVIQGEAIDSTHQVQGKTYYQRQSAFVLSSPFPGRVLVFSVTRTKPLDEALDRSWLELLQSFQARKA